MKTLLELGANINAKDRWGGTPLDGRILFRSNKPTKDAMRHDHVAVAQYLRNEGGHHGTATDFGLELINASSKGDLETVQRLVAAGVSPHSVDYDKRTALHVAVAEKRTDVVTFLLAKGANPNAKDRFSSNITH